MITVYVVAMLMVDHYWQPMLNLSQPPGFYMESREQCEAAVVQADLVYRHGQKFTCLEAQLPAWQVSP